MGMTMTTPLPFGTAVRLKEGGPRMLVMGTCVRGSELLCEWLDEHGVPNVWGFPQSEVLILALPLKELPWRTR
jgi:uncharacterized protein YodC (DUF2158 family)